MAGSIGVRALDSKTVTVRSFGRFVPVVAVLALLVFSGLLLQGVSVVGAWSRTNEPTGHFSVDSCSAPKGRVGTRIECTGELVGSDGGSIASTVVGPRAAFGSQPPGSGEVLDVYYRVGEPGRSFPAEGQSIELARVIAGIVPLLLLAGGLASWVLGWMLTRGLHAPDTATPDTATPDTGRSRWPTRFVLQPRGVIWALVGFVWWLLDVLVIDGVLGVAGMD